MLDTLINAKFKKSLAIIIAALIIMSMVFVGCSTSNTASTTISEKNKVKIQQIEANGQTFKVRTAGLENKGELVVLLHGFPESSIIWTNLMENLAQKGYRCIAPDQRGYSAGARPEGVENYTYKYLTGDVIALADKIGNSEKFHLVGHDWGSSVAWATYGFYPDRIQSLTNMSTPHVQAYLWAFNNDEAQIAATGYIRKYQTPGFEDYFAANDYALLRAAWKDFPQGHIDDYLTIFSVPQARTATINWYRAIFLPTGPNNPELKLGDVTVPTLYIWGNKDPYLVRAGVEKSHTYMKGEYKFITLNADHWLMQFNEKECSDEIIAHITKYSAKK